MKRDWDVIREILLRLEEKPSEKMALEQDDLPEDRRMVIAYDVELLAEAGMIKADVFQSTTELFSAERLTWAGHEFLDAIRSDTVWARTKQSFLSKGLSMTFDLVNSVAIGIATEYLKSAIHS